MRVWGIRFIGEVPGFRGQAISDLRLCLTRACTDIEVQYAMD